jgi:hypothetical protein
MLEFRNRIISHFPGEMIYVFTLVLNTLLLGETRPCMSELDVLSATNFLKKKFG